MAKRGWNNKAQEVFGMSFSMIFAIILIIFFIIVAFVAIKSFLEVQDCAKIRLFITELETDVNRVWNSNDQTEKFKNDLPSGIEYVCFADLKSPAMGGNFERTIYEEIETFDQDNNLFFYPPRKACDMPEENIPHLDIEEMIKTENKNPFCIPIDKGKASMWIEKQSDEKLVRIRR